MADAQLPSKVQKDPVISFLDSKKDALMGAIPRSAANITWESIKQGIWLTLDKNPKLRECHPRTIFASVLFILRLGLDPSGQTGEAFLVPYKGACTPQLGAYGKLRLAQRYGGLVGVPSVDVVFENDECDWDNARNWLVHKQAFGKDRGRPLFIYFRAWMKGGVDRASGLADVQELMPWEDFEQIRENAKAKNFGKLSPAYAAWPLEMAKRSAISRGVKRIDKSPELANLMSEVSTDYEKHANVRRREAVVDESGMVVLDEEFTPQPRLHEDLNVPPADMDPRTGEVIEVAAETPAPAAETPAPVVDPETGERVPEPEELEPPKRAAPKKESPPKPGSQQKIGGMP